MSDPPERRPLASFEIDVAALVAERGRRRRRPFRRIVSTVSRAFTSAG
jgi:hypothetical protein